MSLDRKRPGIVWIMSMYYVGLGVAAAFGAVLLAKLRISISSVTGDSSDVLTGNLMGSGFTVAFTVLCFMSAIGIFKMSRNVMPVLCVLLALTVLDRSIALHEYGSGAITNTAMELVVQAIAISMTHQLRRAGLLR
jgi:hypothetical protein